MKPMKKNTSIPKKYKLLYESSLHEIEKNKQDIIRLEEKLNLYKVENDFLKEQFRLTQQRQFGSSSEKTPLQDKLFDEAEMPHSEEIEEAVSEVRETTPVEHKKSQPKRKPLPDYLPREARVHDIPESDKTCQDCGTKKTCFGKDVSEQLKVIPAQFKVIQHQRLKYCCKSCEGNVSVAPKPMVLFPKSIADASLVAYTIILKYVDHMPLYRQEAIWKRNGVDLPRNTTCAWVIKAAELCEPLYRLMKQQVIDSNYVQADETPVQVLNEKDRKNTQKSYMWVYRKAVGDPIILYEYQQTRQGKHAEHFLMSFEGYLQTDAYAGYNWAEQCSGITRIVCMAHARRYFMDVVKTSKKKNGLAHQAVDLIGELYRIEKAIKNENTDARYKIRQEQAKPQLDKMRRWLNENIGKSPPKSAIGKAMKYLMTNFEKLCTYIDDGRLHIDNNLIENAIRPFAVGKKNWLFAGHPDGAKAGAILYSLLMTAKAHNLNQHAYLTYVFDHLRGCESDEDYLKLLPTDMDLEQRQKLTL